MSIRRDLLLRSALLRLPEPPPAHPAPPAPVPAAAAAVAIAMPGARRTGRAAPRRRAPKPQG